MWKEPLTADPQDVFRGPNDIFSGGGPGCLGNFYFRATRGTSQFSMIRCQHLSQANQMITHQACHGGKTWPISKLPMAYFSRSSVLKKQKALASEVIGWWNLNCHFAARKFCMSLWLAIRREKTTGAGANGTSKKQCLKVNPWQRKRVGVFEKRCQDWLYVYETEKYHRNMCVCASIDIYRYIYICTYIWGLCAFHAP